MQSKARDANIGFLHSHKIHIMWEVLCHKELLYSFCDFAHVAYMCTSTYCIMLHTNITLYSFTCFFLSLCLSGTSGVNHHSSWVCPCHSCSIFRSLLPPLLLLPILLLLPLLPLLTILTPSLLPLRATLARFGVILPHWSNQRSKEGGRKQSRNEAK